MKKILILMLALMLVFSVVACQGENKETTETEKTTEAKEESTESTEESKDSNIVIGLVTDTGGIDDKSFNQGTWEGLEKFSKDNNLPEGNLSYLQSTSDADYIPNLAQYAELGADLIVAPGFLFEDAIKETATMFPEQKILFIDAVVDSPNVANAIFAEHEGSFLTGVAAALKAQEAGMTQVGFIGGGDFPLINKFEAGFEQGVKPVDPKMEIVIQYATGFAKPEEGQTIAAKMYDQGVYVIYHAAGATGTGVIKEAIDRNKNGEEAWVVGVDKDQYEEGKYDGEKSIILTSMVKGVDTASYDMATKVANGTFEGGTFVYGLKENGVGLPENNPNLKEEWLTKIDEFAQKIIDGELTVDEIPSRLK